MPLTECPDCGGVVSDQALTCPTCHRVLGAVPAPGVALARRVVRGVLFGALILTVLWLLARVTGVL